MGGTRIGFYGLVEVLRDMRVEFIYMGGAIGVVPNPSLASYSSYTALRKPDLTITHDYFRRHILSGQSMARTEKGSTTSEFYI